jgi:hypothetical protein
MKYLLIVFFYLFLNGITSNVYAQNFDFKNWVWAYPNCNEPETVRTWWDSGNKKIRLFQLNKDGATYRDILKIVSNKKYGVGSYQFISDANYNETYVFYNNNTARVFERSIDGKLSISNGKLLVNGEESSTLYACGPNTKAAKEIVNTISLTDANNSSSNKQNKSNEKSVPSSNAGEEFIPDSCREAQALVNKTVDLMPSMICASLTELSLCLKANNGYSKNISSLMNICEEDQKQKDQTKCTRYAQAKQNCAPANNFESCMNRMGFYELDKLQCGSMTSNDGW